MERNRSSRTLAGALLLAVCGPIAAFGIGVASPGSDAPQARRTTLGHAHRICRAGSCNADTRNSRTPQTTNA